MILQKGRASPKTRVHFWDVPKRLESPTVKKTKSVHNISLHSEVHGNVLHIGWE